MESAPTFRELFGRAPEVVTLAHGRANLIGEHTDHSGGYVLPLPVPLFTRVELAVRADPEVHLHSVPLHASAQFVLGETPAPPAWVIYPWAATQVAGARPLSGFDARIDGTLPMGVGLASSAALLVALLRALRSAFAWGLDDVALGLLAHRAEVERVGVPVGTMDPLAASLGRQGSALFIDTTSLRTEQVPLPASFGLAVVSSGLEHRLAESGYRRRREECREAAAALGVSSLRALSLADLPRLAGLPAPLDRRARHVVTENARVLDALPALRAGDLKLLGALFDASHRSLRNDFEVIPPEVETLVSLARRSPGILGARMTGGGFGGAIVVLGPPEGLREAMEAVAADYSHKVGRAATVLLPE